MLYDGDSDAPHMKIRKSDYSDEPIELTLPIAPGESFRWVEIGNGPIILACFSTAKKGVDALRTFALAYGTVPVSVAHSYLRTSCPSRRSHT